MLWFQDLLQVPVPAFRPSASVHVQRVARCHAVFQHNASETPGPKVINEAEADECLRHPSPGSLLAAVLLIGVSGTVAYMYSSTLNAFLYSPLGLHSNEVDVTSLASAAEKFSWWPEQAGR
jgi:hypothetical protein